MTVNSTQRFSASSTCPVCGGYDRAARGRGVRCFGYISPEREWAYCTRAEAAGGLKLNTNSETYSHRLGAQCACGVSHTGDNHASAQPEPPKPSRRVIASYDYENAVGKVIYRILRFDDKSFTQQSPDSNGGWKTGRRGIPAVLYRLPELLQAEEQTPIFIVEGEKDVDRLVGIGIVATTNPQGAGKWSADFIPHFAGRSVVIIPDNDPPNPSRPSEHHKGQVHAGAVARSLNGVAASIKVLELPNLPSKGDVSDWLDDGHTYDQLIILAANCRPYSETSSAYEEAYFLRQNGNENGKEVDQEPVIYEGSERYRSIAHRIINKGLLTHGYFVSTPNCPYFFDHESGQLVELASFDMEKLLNRRYRMNSTERLYNFLLQEMRVEADLTGRKVTVHQFACYQPDTNTLYLDQGKGKILKLDGDNIEQVPNGENGVLFVQNGNTEPWEYDPRGPEGILGEMLIDGVSFAAGSTTPHTPREQKLLFLIWMLSLAFGTVQPTKPIALALGPRGSGKSLLFRMVGIILQGTDFNVTVALKDREDDFYTSVTNNNLVVVDNLDTYIPWMEPAMAILATGAKIYKRVLHTTNTLASYTPQCFMAATARTPKFRASDVAERLLIFRLSRRDEPDDYGNGVLEFEPEHLFKQRIIDNRDLLMSDYARMLNKIVATPNRPPTVQGIRMADFAHLAERIGSGMGAAKMTTGALEKMKLAQDIYATEENPLQVLLDFWIDEDYQDPRAMLPAEPNSNRWVLVKDLYGELRRVAETMKIQWRIENHVAMGIQLKEMEKPLGLYFKIEHKRLKKGSAWHFERMRSVQLEG